MLKRKKKKIIPFFISGLIMYLVLFNIAIPTTVTIIALSIKIVLGILLYTGIMTIYIWISHKTINELF